ncbi:uncharacterized protein B0I36DRAFT_94032 [Microdochium trichocladiopsis]|uniref:Uncharacterized protein n=1 Tax=Microdochium trichocladiopsis TaxID=1682393 RepID=A0A9P9BWY8_9PEZI|nr:uncharacterized protein B0I36DRAFT_94032 [Microdochium trichocladiopsis]KAH7035566.1 hypothetical protein B0I36DRAFT_94032 [Microdochium trichocladiopsis]
MIRHVRLVSESNLKTAESVCFWCFFLFLPALFFLSLSVPADGFFSSFPCISWVSLFHFTLTSLGEGRGSIGILFYGRHYSCVVGIKLLFIAESFLFGVMLLPSDLRLGGGAFRLYTFLLLLPPVALN